MAWKKPHVASAASKRQWWTNGQRSARAQARATTASARAGVATGARHVSATTARTIHVAARSRAVGCISELWSDWGSLSIFSSGDFA